MRILVQIQHFAQGGNTDLVDPQGALQGIAPHPVHQFPPTHDYSGLGSSKQFVAAERYEVDAFGERFVDGRFMRQAVTHEVDQGARTEVVYKGQPVFTGQLTQILPGNRIGEAAHLVVTRMHLHQQRGTFIDRVFVVAQMRAIGGSGFAEDAIGALHDLGHAERAADLHEFAAGNHDFAPGGQRIEHEQHGGGIVVDHGGGFSAGQFAKRRFEMMVAVAAMSRLKIVFQVAGARRRRHRLDRFRRQGGSAQIGMHHGAAEIEHRLERSAELRNEFAPHCRIQSVLEIRSRNQGLGIPVAVPQCLAQTREFALRGKLACLRAILPDQPGKFGRVEHPVDRRQGSQSLVTRHDLLVLFWRRNETGHGAANCNTADSC